MDRVIQTKEQADHSLPYLLAVALLDGDVQPAQFKPDRIIKADVCEIESWSAADKSFTSDSVTLWRKPRPTVCETF
jgi:MmgE/PrpD C-terminal domain